MNAILDSPTNPRWRPRKVACLAARLLLCIVAGFWAWFASMNVVSDGLASLWPALAVITPLGLVAVTVWRFPVVGGCLAIGAGLASAYVFPHPAALLLMSAPLSAGGVTLLVCARRT